MRSPEEMKTIQIDITNACIHNCSNCTRMCGHHNKPYFMSWDTFKRAVDSLDGFQGIIGVMGGEPTLHPEFERFAQYLDSKYAQKKENNYFIEPTKNFMRDRKLEERNLTYSYDSTQGVNQRIKGPGLWSSLASNYNKYYEVIQDVFRYQCLNDHMISSFHQPILVSRKDLGIPDEEWYSLRDHCWMQNVWSASITPKGCFFCEVAGALDMLFDGPGGWPIEPGWWKRKPEEFGEQLQWCELCGIALNTRSRDANEEIDDASVTLYKMLEKLQTPKFKRGQVDIYMNKQEEQPRKFEYHDNNFNRLSRNNHAIYPSKFWLMYISDEKDTYDDVRQFIEYYKDVIENMILFVSDTIVSRIMVDKLTDEYQNISIFSKETRWGENINRAHRITGELANIFMITSKVRIEKELFEDMKLYAINPGTLHMLTNSNDKNNAKITFLDSVKEERLFLYNPWALALRKAGYDGISYCKNEKEFMSLWALEKRVYLDDVVLNGRDLVNPIDILPDFRYVIYGTGTYGEKAYEKIMEIGAEIICYCDSDKRKQQTKKKDYDVLAPDQIENMYKKEFDKVIIASLAYKDIRNKLLQMGIVDEDIIAPIF